MTVAPTTRDLVAYVPRLLTGERARHAPTAWTATGSLLFADVSGFTRLTEKLARRGKIGAEQMVATISEVFTRLLTASEDGGDLLKFGGDALLVLYEGPDHAVRAAHAARAMQQALREHGRVMTPSGPVRLRMSVGIHSGDVPLFLCGDDHIELLVLGDAATTTVTMESTAEAGEILISPATAALLPPRCVGTPKGDGYLLRQSPPAQPLVVLPEPVGHDLERFVPPPLRGRLGSGGLEQEHRHATVAFVSFGGTDAIIRDRGLAAAHEHVQHLTTAVMAVLDEYGVLLTCADIGPDGGKFMLTAGAPDASDDDEGRMLRAARAIVEVDGALPVRVGVNSGRVFTGDVGAPFRRTYSTMGDATNLAARVMGKAPWGDVLATSVTLAAARGRFVSRPLPPFPVKGKSRPVEAALVTGVDEAAVEVDDRRVPLVGRGEELRKLEAAAGAVRAGRGTAVELVGELGSGRSRLVAELAERCGDLPWLTTVCDPYERSSTYHLGRELLRRLLGIPVRAHPPEAGDVLRRVVLDAVPHLLPWLPLLALPVGAAVPGTREADDVSARFRRDRVHELVAELVVAVASGPRVIVLEDASHMDDASADLLADLLTRELGRLGWLVLVTRQDVPAGLHAARGYDAEVLRLTPLSDREAGALVAGLAETTAIPAHVQREIVARGGGHPLFLAELVAARTTSDVGELPPSVEAIVAARIDALAPADRRVLRSVSVLGERFDASMLDASLGSVGVASDDVELWSRLQGFVSRSGRTFAFANGLIPVVAYEGLPYRRRRELHGLVADALLGTDADDERRGQLPVHLARAERWSEVWELAVAAGDAARQAGASVTAAELYELALSAASDLGRPRDDLAEVAERCGDVYELAGLYDEAVRSYTTAKRATSEPGRAVGLMAKQGIVNERAGRYSQALRWHGRGLTAAQELPPGPQRSRVMARLHVGSAAARFRQGQLQRCIEHARAAIPHAEDAGDDATLAHAYYLLDGAYTDLGDEANADRFRHLALPLYERVGDLVGQGIVLNNLGVDAFAEGRFEASIELYERSREVQRRAGNVVAAAMAANNIGESLLALGRVAEARPLFADALAVWRGARYPVGVGLAARNLGEVALRAGEDDEGIARLEEALRTFRDIGAEPFVLEAVVPLATALERSGRVVEAWELATQTLETTKDPATRTAAICLQARCLLATGGDARAVELLRAHRDELEAEGRAAGPCEVDELLARCVS